MKKPSMRVRITQEPPVDKKHGMAIGRIFDTCDPPEDAESRGTWVVGDLGEPVKLFNMEFEEIPEVG